MKKNLILRFYLPIMSLISTKNCDDPSVLEAKLTELQTWKQFFDVYDL